MDREHTDLLCPVHSTPHKLKAFTYLQRSTPKGGIFSFFALFARHHLLLTICGHQVLPTLQLFSSRHCNWNFVDVYRCLEKAYFVLCASSPWSFNNDLTLSETTWSILSAIPTAQNRWDRTQIWEIHICRQTFLALPTLHHENCHQTNSVL